MLALSDGAQEYLYTICVTAAFVGMLAALFLARRDITGLFKRLKIKKTHVVWAFVILAIFIAIELFTVAATQQLFFDDVIYQGMAVALLHTGQAWMCNFGTPIACYSGEIFHEPIGTAFNLAIAFAALGVSRAAAFGTELALSAIAVFLMFPLALLFLKNVKGALFAELFTALSPILLIWAKPTTSDIPMLAYSIVAMLALLIFINRRNARTLALAIFATAFLLYTKVDAMMYLPVMLVMYVLLSDGGLMQSIRRNARRAYESLFSTKVLILALVFVLLVAPEAGYALNELQNGNYGYSGAYIGETCANPIIATIANSSISFTNLKYNICSNVLFWFNGYDSALMPQPIIFTVFALLGAALMIAYRKRRELAALAVWFLAFFLLYTSFYAGSVTYGVDWRFMLTAVAPVAIMGGAGASYVIEWTGIMRMMRKPKHLVAAARTVVTIAMLALIVLGFSSAVPAITENPAMITQAGNARFYENFVYSSISAIPSSCIVYSYDPTLFIINGRASAQMSYLYNTSFYEQSNAVYGCSVLDYGYWCGTPGNICTSIMGMYNTTLIMNATHGEPGSASTYGFYRINGLTNGTRPG
jgi:hypothetical protein